MKYVFIINPTAGKGRFAPALIEKIHQQAQARHLTAEVVETTGKGDAARIAKKACLDAAGEEIRLYACGGDGTLHEVVNGAVGFPNACVGLMPTGTGNDFARNFSGQEAFLDPACQLDAKPVSLDLIRCNDVFCVNMINVGFDCEVVHKTGEIKNNRFVLPQLAYLFGVFLTLVRKPGVSFHLSVDGGEEKDFSLLLSAFANGDYCGGGFCSNPRADLRDSLFDCCMVKNVTRRRFLRLLPLYKKGTHLAKTDLISYRQARRMDIRFDREQSVCIDGQISPLRQMHLAAVPGALRFLMPAGANFKKEQKEPLPDSQTPDSFAAVS